MEDNMKPGWRTSSYTGNGGGNCVEVGGAARMILVRDTKDRTGPVLRFTPAAWRGFAERLKRPLRPAPSGERPEPQYAQRCSLHVCVSLREFEPADRDMLPADSRSCRRPSGPAQ